MIAAIKRLELHCTCTRCAGRLDDVINVSGHRIGTAEVENALALNEQCAEAAVVGFTHDIKGQGIYAYVTLVDSAEPSDALRKELVTCASVLCDHLCAAGFTARPVLGCACQAAHSAHTCAVARL